MVYPGLPGQVGPPPATTVGWQVRQSRAGRVAGTTAIDAMGANAPSSAVTALTVNAAEEYLDNPHPIEGENFELNVDSAPDFGSTSYSGQGSS